MRRLPGSHAPNCKNRSSKQNTWLSGVGFKSNIRSMSGEGLKALADKEYEPAVLEIKRRKNLRRNVA